MSSLKRFISNTCGEPQDRTFTRSNCLFFHEDISDAKDLNASMKE